MRTSSSADGSEQPARTPAAQSGIAGSDRTSGMMNRRASTTAIGQHRPSRAAQETSASLEREGRQARRPRTAHAAGTRDRRAARSSRFARPIHGRAQHLNLRLTLEVVPARLGAVAAGGHVAPWRRVPPLARVEEQPQALCVGALTDALRPGAHQQIRSRPNHRRHSS